MQSGGEDMKRTAAAIFALLAVFTGVRCRAAGGFTCEYAPKSDRSAVFYIDIRCADAVSAALMELRFDDRLAEYRETVAERASSGVRARCAGGRVEIAFADSRAESGRLCRAVFRTRQAVDCDFTLSITQATNAKSGLTQAYPACSVTVRLCEDDIVVPDAASPTPAQQNEPVSLFSTVSTADAEEARTEREEADVPSSRSVPLDLHDDSSLTYLLLGAGAGAAAVILILLGCLLVHRLRRRSAQKAAASADPAEGAAEK